MRISREIKESVLRRTRKCRKTLKPKDYIDPRRILATEEEIEAFWSHSEIMQRSFPRLNHNERTVIILNKVFGHGRKDLRAKLRISKHRFYQIMESFSSYDKVIYPSESRTL